MATTSTQKKPSPYGPKKFSSIDEYHAFFPEEISVKLEQLRQAIKSAAPKAEETISYNMPAFRQHRNLVYYSVHTSHIGFYPTNSPIKYFKEDLIKFKHSKGAIQFPLDKPLPIALIKKIVKFRLAEELEKLKTK